MQLTITYKPVCSDCGEQLMQVVSPKPKFDKYTGDYVVEIVPHACKKEK